jgi:serine/threonine protein phosphatase 1
MARWGAIPRGQRVYAIGDVHGCYDLLVDLIRRIREDDAARAEAQTTIVFLGDLIDRGPASAQVVTHLMRWTERSDRVVVLKGNHEEMMADALGGDLEVLQAWLGFGGRETLLSWGLAADLLDGGDLVGILEAATQAIDPAVRRWVDRLPSSAHIGGWLFVHAGVRPGLTLARQHEQDMLWIGEEFLSSKLRHPWRVMHGHTVVEDGPDLRPNRIGLDTGAYRTGRLSAAGLEDEDVWFLVTEGRTELTLRSEVDPG